MLVAPLPAADAREQELVKGPNIASLPEFDPLPDRIEATVELKAADDISADEILPAGAEVLPLRSNIPAISRFVFRQLDADYAGRVAAADGPHLVVAGENYGQGSSREHAVIAPGYLGPRAVIAKSFARIHFQNLANFGILPLRFEDPADYDSVGQGDVLTFDSLRTQLSSGGPVRARHGGREVRLAMTCPSARSRCAGRRLHSAIGGPGHLTACLRRTTLVLPSLAGRAARGWTDRGRRRRPGTFLPAPTASPRALCGRLPARPAGPRDTGRFSLSRGVSPCHAAGRCVGVSMDV